MMNELTVITDKGLFTHYRMAATPSLSVYHCREGCDENGNTYEFQVLEVTYVLADKTLYRGELVIAVGGCPYGDGVIGVSA
jgi:hypothetical protein